MIALILARSGSKGIPNKNILKLGNIRISHYSIKAALESSKIDMTVYSSDSNQYIELAKQFVTENFQSKKNTFKNHKRSTKAAGDNISTWDSAIEILDDLNIKNSEKVLVISASCPSITSNDVNNFIKSCLNFSSCFSVRKNDYPIENTFYIKNDFYVAHKLSKKIKGRQFSDPVYRPDGHLYLRSAKDIRAKKNFPDEETLTIDLQKKYYLNIDSDIDLELAKHILQNGNF